MGGVTTGCDALEMIACGATHVALGTVLFSDPDAPRRVREELDDAARHVGFASHEYAFCAAHSRVASVAN
jgi:dihydroorotate dehydrogenase (NAD+) catalytic subunit